jgi:hypothetical protein
MTMRKTAFISLLMVSFAVVSAVPTLSAERSMSAAPANRFMLAPTAARTVQWHPGVAAVELQSAQIIRIAPGFHRTDLSALRDDQMIETPSGNRVAVRKLRFIQQAVAQARAKTAVKRQGAFKILPPTFASCVKPAPGETAAQILARPPTDIICTPSGRSVSVAQLRLIAPTVQQRPQMRSLQRVFSAPGPAIQILSRDDLRAQFHTNLKNAPDSTVLASPKGTRVTIGQLKALLKANAPPRPSIRSMGGRAQ